MYYPKAYTNLGRCFLEFINKRLQKPWNEENIQNNLSDIDEKAHFFYRQVVSYAIELSKESPIKSVIRYPYPADYSGVSMSAYVVQETNHHGPDIHGNKYWDASDFLQHQEIESDLQKIKNEIHTAVKSSDISKPLLATIDQDRHHFHAEEYWFSMELKNFIQYLKNYRSNWTMSKPEDDEIWIQQLKAPTRIEFVISSAPCDDCQLLFKDLRRILNELNLMLPIIIFFNLPTNTTEKRQSQIALVSFSGEYFNTGLIPDTPNAKKERASNRTFDLTSTFRLFNRETQIFYRFEPVVGQVMPLMMSPSTTSEERNEFIDDMFNFFGHCDVINKNALPWFICFLKNLPDMPGGFYTSKRMQENFPVAGYPNASKMGMRVLKETRVKSFLDTTLGNKPKKIDYLAPTRMTGSHINTQPQSFTYIADKFQLLIKPYAESHEKKTLSDYLKVKGRLESFYLKDNNEQESASENQVEYVRKYN